MHDGKPLLPYILLCFVIIVWAVAWPVSKIGLNDMTPVWYSVMRLVIGFITMFAILLACNKIKRPTRNDLPMIISIGLLQMGLFLILLNSGLLFVDASRSVILVYTTPLFVTPIAILFFEERLTIAKLIGLLFGLLGLILLFAPWTFNWYDRSTLFGNGLLLLAAVSWAAAMLHTRYGKWHKPSIFLIPWQLLIATLFVIIAAIFLEPHPVIHWTPRLVLTGLYTGILATGFAYTAMVYISQQLPVITTSLLLLIVPVLGLITSAWWLKEQITITMLIALLAIITGLVTIIIENRRGSKRDN